MKPDALSIAVVIVAWQDHDALDECLAALERQSIRPDEVLVADNGAGLEARLEPWRARLPITRIDMGSNRGPSAARNAAVAASTADPFLFLDDDAVPAERWIEAFVAILTDDPDIAAARGKVEPRNARLLNELARAYDLGSEVRPAIINTEGNCAIRRHVLEQTGGFDSAMFGHEGAELSRRIISDFGEEAIVYVPDAVIHHDYVDGLADYVRKRFRHGRMLRHLDVAFTRRAAARSVSGAKWTWRKLLMMPVKALGICAELAGLAWSFVPATSRSGVAS